MKEPTKRESRKRSELKETKKQKEAKEKKENEKDMETDKPATFHSKMKRKLERNSKVFTKTVTRIQELDL